MGERGRLGEGEGERLRFVRTWRAVMASSCVRLPFWRWAATSSCSPRANHQHKQTGGVGAGE